MYQPEPIRVALVDDHVLVRNGLKQLLELEADLTVVGEAGDSARAAAMVQAVQPDVLLLDIEIPGDDVTVTVERVRTTSPQTKILILSMYDGPLLMKTLLDMGVRGCLLKSVTQHELVAAIHAVCEDPSRVVLSISQRSIAAMHQAESDRLTDREREVLQLTANAMSNTQIGRQLGLTEATVKRHLRNIFIKLDAVSRIDAVNKATASGILPGGKRH